MHVHGDYDAWAARGAHDCMLLVARSALVVTLVLTFQVMLRGTAACSMHARYALARPLPHAWKPAHCMLRRCRRLSRGSSLKLAVDLAW